jgi:homoserine O-acetyltransferase
MIGPGQADRHRQLLRHQLERARRLPRQHRSVRRPIPQPAKPWGLDFPVITIPDMVRAQAMLIDSSRHRYAVCGRRRLDGRHAGAAMGGRLSRSACSRRCLIACATRHSAQNIAFHEVGRQAVMADPDWHATGATFAAGRACRIAASASRAWPRTSPICLIAALHRKFGRRAAGPRRCRRSRSTRISKSRATCGYQGSTFVERFDANSYLYLTRGDATISTSPPTMAARWPRRRKGTSTRFCVISFTSDWLYPDFGIARRRACAQCRRCAGVVRGDRDRQGPRCVPAGRAGVHRHRACIPGLVPR